MSNFNTNSSSEDFSDDHIPQANWMSWDKIGDNIKGTFTGKSHREGKTKGNIKYPDQIVFNLSNVTVNGKAEEGDWNVGIKVSNTFVLGRLKNVKVGQRIGFKFTSEFPTDGFPAKSIIPYLWEMDPTYKIAEDFGGSVLEDGEPNPFAN